MSARPAWPDRFLKELRERGTTSAAAEAAGVGRSTVYDEMERNPEFAADVAEARQRCVEDLEATLFQRAIAGDNTAAIFLMKGYDPARFGDGLRADQIRQLREEERKRTLAEIESEVARLPEQARKIVMEAMAKATKELAP